MISNVQQQFMREAIELSRSNVRECKGGPFAALVVRGDTIIARGTNLVTSTNDPTAHAEIVAIRAACQVLGAFQLTGCDIYTTCEPCPMCLGAIYWARPRAVYYANTKHDAAGIGFDDRFIYDEFPLPHEQRKIPMRQILRDEAYVAFREWTDKSDKISY
ncbi:MAG: nucleoside deaminase [Bacteroidota bacterium]|jgi:tRNA(Arg) A34 adenosine deaminase TadA